LHFQDTSATPDEDLEQNFERNRERVLARVAQYIQRAKLPGSILDVGCATGFFLARFFRQPPWQASAIELSRHKARRAAQNGIRVFVGDIHAAKFGAGVFDVITVLDAFYYFPNPQAELAEFRRILKDGGLLVLELPWANSRIWRRSVAKAGLLPGGSRPLLETSDHLFYYTPKSIALLLERCGFQVRARVTVPGNRQEDISRDLLWRLYSWFSRAIGILSGSKLFLGPRFLAVAEKTPER
jgi:SAM-dependent methyltransferase